MSEFPDLPSLETQLRQHTADLPLRIISTIWAGNSGYHPGYRNLINRCGSAEMDGRTAQVRILV
jgi:hypothetical protein